MLRLVLLLPLLLPSRPQGGGAPEGFDQAYTRGYEARIAGRLDESIAAFQKSLELRRIAPGVAFQLACCYSEKGEVESAFTWLERALFEWSLPAIESNLALLASGTGLDPLRADPRFANALARFRARVERETPPPVPGVYIDWIGGHAQSVPTAAFSPDGERIVTGSHDRSARVWSTRSGETLLVLNGHVNTVLSASFSSDGEQILTGGFDNQLRLWDARIGQPLARWSSSAGGVRRCGFSPDEQWILVAGQLSAALIDARTGEVVRGFAGHSQHLNDAAYGPDGLHVATASRDQTARLYDARTGALVHALEGHRGFVWGVAFSPDGMRLLTTGADGMARIWSVGTGACELVIQSTGELRKGSFSPDGRRVVIGCLDGRARVWNTESGHLELELSGHEREVRIASYSADGTRILTASWDGSARVWNAITGAQELALVGWPSVERTLAFSPDGERLVTFDDSGSREWDRRTLSELVPRGHSTKVRCGTRVESTGALTGFSRDPRSYSWDLDAVSAPIELEGLATEPVAIFLSPGGERLYTVGRDDSARLWDVESGKQIADLGPLSSDFNLSGNVDRVTSASFSPDGTRLVTAQHPAGTARLWDARTGAELFVLHDQDAFILCASFSPTGERVLTTSPDRSISIWSAGTGEKLVRLMGHTNWAMQAVFSADGEQIASAGADNTIRVWSAATGECLQVLKDAAGSVRSVALSPDGHHLAAADWDHRVSVWDLARGRLLGTLVPGERAEWLAFTPSLHYHGTPKAIARARLVIAGVAFPLACFASILERDDAVRASLAGEELEAARVPLPPILLISVPAEAEASTSEREVRIQAQAVDALAGLERIDVVQDGERIAPDKLAGSLVLENEGRLARIDLRLPIPAGRTETTIVLQAVNTRGILSRQESRRVRYEPPKRELYVLALGVADYDDDALDLNYPVRDVDDLIARLQAQSGELYHKVHVERRVDRDVTSAEALRLRDEFLLQARPDDTIVVFTAGHGVRSASSEYWFLTSSATPARPYSGINRATLESLVTWDKLHASRRVLLIDTCHAGKAFEGTRGERGLAAFRQDEVDAALAGSSGLYIFAATSDDAFAREQEGNGIFTRAILDGLAGAADEGSFGDKDGYVGVSELMQFARYAVLEKSAGRQVPTFPRIEGGENFPLARARVAAREDK